MAHPLLSKLNFSLGRNPNLEKRRDWRRFIPEPFSAVVLIQVDFEMAWASRWSRRFDGDPDGVLQNARRERQNIPKILDLCDRFKVPLTWATVGHLMLDGCRSQGGIAHHELPRPGHFENDFWRFTEGDWFKHDPETDVLRDPEWYACDLIADIVNRKVKHEIGCHTFSHIDCRNEVCSPDLMRAEIKACQQIAKNIRIELKTFVHPAHTIGNLEILKEIGFTSFRSDYSNILGYPVNHGAGLWEIKSTMEFAYRKEWSFSYHIYRYCKIIDRAIKEHSICTFWFHPSISEEFVFEVIPNIFYHLNENRKHVLLTTTSDYISWLNKS